MQISHLKQTGIKSIDIYNIAKEKRSTKRNHSTLILFLIPRGQIF